MSEDLRALLESSGAILHGHFILTSGRHSDVYIEKFRVLEQTRVLSRLCHEIATHTRPWGYSTVAGPTTGGIIVAYAVALAMEQPALYVESENGRKALRRGATIAPGTRVLVVDDVLTTGRSVREVMHVIREAGGEVGGVAVLIDRSEESIDFGVPLFAACRVEAHSYAPAAVPDWLAAIPAQKPGTREEL